MKTHCKRGHERSPENVNKWKQCIVCHKVRIIRTDMLKRCYNSKHPAFKHYGARGIVVCDEWRYNLETWMTWALPKQEPGLEIDRIDNNGNYEPSKSRGLASFCS